MCVDLIFITKLEKCRAKTVLWKKRSFKPGLKPPGLRGEKSEKGPPAPIGAPSEKRDRAIFFFFNLQL